MKPRFYYYVLIAAVAISACSFLYKTSAAQGAADDWPQWRGPNRDGISRETGLLKTWPKAGPKVLWRVPSGEGYAGIVIAKGRGYTMFGEGDSEFMVAFDPASGKETWRYKMDGILYNDQGNGPRSTPLVEGNLVYGLSGNGKLHAVNAQNGEAVWSHDLRAEYGGKSPIWGISTMPLVESELLIVDVGGNDGHAVMAILRWSKPRRRDIKKERMPKF